MRSIQLIRLALEAEALRLRHMAKRTVSRVVFGCFAMALAAGVGIFLHIAAWFWLRQHLAGEYVGLIFAGVDLLLAVILAMLATRSAPGRVEIDALDVRRRALDDAAGSFTISALLIRAIDMALSTRFRR